MFWTRAGFVGKMECEFNGRCILINTVVVSEAWVKPSRVEYPDRAVRKRMEG